LEAITLYDARLFESLIVLHYRDRECIGIDYGSYIVRIYWDRIGNRESL
jgi:hypothetical protein